MDIFDSQIAKNETKTSKPKILKFLFWTFGTALFTLIVVGIFSVLAFQNLNTAPVNFPTNVKFEIEPGTSVKLIAKKLEENAIIKSAHLFYLLANSKYDATKIKASTYQFSEPLSTIEVIEKLIEGDFSTDLVKLTIPEGLPTKEVARIINETFPNISTKEFLDLASSSEGFLFPETYHLPGTATALDIYNLLKETHAEVMTELTITGFSTKLTADEVVILASIIEREANSKESMGMVSGILQNRLAINMPLQADATMEYVLDKPLSQLLASDLKKESPYNTYLNTGLTPTPISNPGRDALIAALNPTPSDYYFYITAPDGTFYYAENFDQHRINIARYLR